MSEAEDQAPELEIQTKEAPSLTMSPVQDQKSGSKSLKLHFAESNQNSTVEANSSIEVKNKTSNLTLVSKNDTKVLNKTNSTKANATLSKEKIFNNT